MVVKERSHRYRKRDGRVQVVNVVTRCCVVRSTHPKPGSRALIPDQRMTHLNTTPGAGPSNTRSLTTKPMDTANTANTAETPSGFATLTNDVSLDADDEDQDDSMDWEEVDILGTEVPTVQPITEVEVTLGENQPVKTSRK